MPRLPATLPYKVGSAVAHVLPAPVGRVLARGAGRAAARSDEDRRRMVARHLQRVCGPQLQGHALDTAVRSAFASYARYWVESFRLPHATTAEIERTFSYDGAGHIDAALGLGKGCIVALPHLGGWEHAAAWMRAQGHKLTVVVEPLEPPEVFEWFVDLREALGMSVIPVGPGAAAAVLAALRDDHVVCLVCDRDLTGDGIEVDFFGERTTVPGGPATLALRSGAPIIPPAVYFDGPTRTKAVVRPPLPGVERRGRLRADVERITQALTAELEDLIRAAPEQWHLMQPNWPSDRDPDHPARFS